MAIGKQLIPLAFGQGLDTKKDKKQQLFGMLRKAENTVFETLDSARKRNGYDSISLRTTAGTPISTAQHLSSFKDELLLFDASKIYGFSDSLQAMQPKGNIYSIFPTSWPVVNNSYQNSQVDMLVVQGLKIFAYRNETLGEIRYSVQDINTQTMLVSDAVLATGRTPRLASINNVVYVFYGEGVSANLRFKTFNITNPTTLSGPFLFASNYDSTFSNLDVVTVADRIVVFYCSTNGGQRLTYGSVGANNSPSVLTALVGQDCTAALDILLTSDSRLVVTYASATLVKVVIFTGNLLTQLLAPTVIEAVANASKVCAAELSLGNYLVYYGISSTPTYNHKVRKANLTLGGAVTNVGNYLLSVDLASKPFNVGNQAFVLLSYDSVSQPTYFVADTNGTVVAKISPSLSGGHLQAGNLPKVYKRSDDIAIIPSLYKTKFLAANGEFFSLRGVTNTEVDFVVEDRYANAPLGNNLLVAGGIVQGYDGNSVAEYGFNVFPEAPTLTAVSAGVPTNNPTRSMAHGNYGYCLVYRWTDNQGNEHRSVPSEIVNVTVSNPHDAVEILCPTLRLTGKSNVVIEIYRTEASGTTFYLISDPIHSLYSVSNVDNVLYRDGRSDAQIISSRILYTTGGVLENTAPPSARVLGVHTASQRVFLAGLEDRNLLQYSKVCNSGQPVEFNDALTIPIDPVGGDITAVASMDEKLIVFETDAIFQIAGNGPNNLGQQNSFTTPERVSTDVGCLDPKSVVLTPDGLMFKSRKGIYLLSRGLGLSYIGAPVEAFNALTISSAKVVAELNQVRFTTIDGDCLVYNYVYKFWATFTNHKALSAEVINNNYYYLRTNAELYKENRLSFSDAGVPIKLRVEVGWISFGVLQGFSRVYKMLFLGDWLSKHKLLVKVGYNFNEAWTQSVLIDPAVAEIDAVAYGDDSPYGEPVAKPYGGAGTAYQGRVNFKQQKCQSIKLEIEDVQENAGEGFSLSQLTFEVGGKGGLFKLPKGQKFATK
jgi:hypothetical protein